MAALKLRLSSFLFFVLLPAVLLLPHLANCSDAEDNLLQGLNSYRTSLSLPILAKNGKAECLADKIAEELEDQPCNAASSIKAPQLANYDRLIDKCKIDINSTTDAAIMPVCVRKLVPTLVLTNYTHSQYAKQLNNSKFTGAGVGSEDDWMVVILTTNTRAGSFISGGGSLGYSKVGVGGFFMVYLLVGLVLFN